MVFDDASTGFAFLAWRQVEWPWYVGPAGEGVTHPAVGDVDGDGIGEILLGLGPGSGGWVEILNGVADGFGHRAWVRAPWPDYNTYSGKTWPGAGDVDGDGVDEIVVGLGGGSQGWFAVLDDAAHGFAIVRWLRLGWPGVQRAQRRNASRGRQPRC